MATTSRPIINSKTLIFELDATNKSTIKDDIEINVGGMHLKHTKYGFTTDWISDVEYLCH